MGDRYILTVVCPACQHKQDEVYYAPTCGFKDWKCSCGHVVNLEEYTGISEAECSNLGMIKAIIRKAKRRSHE
jgi:hypothetical protein